MKRAKGTKSLLTHIGLTLVIFNFKRVVIIDRILLLLLTAYLRHIVITLPDMWCTLLNYNIANSLCVKISQGV